MLHLRVIIRVRLFWPNDSCYFFAAHACTHTHTHTHSPPHIYIYIYIYIYIQIYIYIYIYIFKKNKTTSCLFFFSLKRWTLKSRFKTVDKNKLKENFIRTHFLLATVSFTGCIFNHQTRYVILFEKRNHIETLLSFFTLELASGLSLDSKR